jgi:hypothetical protein
VELGVDDFIVVLVGLVVDDLQDLNEAEGGPQPSQDVSWSGSSLAMGAGRLSPRWLVASGPEVQVHPAALPLQFIVISSRVEARPVDQKRCVADSASTRREQAV